MVQPPKPFTVFYWRNIHLPNHHFHQQSVSPVTPSMSPILSTSTELMVPSSETLLRMDGAEGPSGTDAAGWKRLCTSFRSHSSDLCDAIASLAKRICTAYLDPKGLEAFVACRLITLDKCPGVRPIGIGETLRRIIGKAISNTLKYDIQDAVGPLQLCAAFEGGCEAAVHAMQQQFSLPQFDAVIQVDACNAFNSLNRQTALRSILHLCPSLAKVLINTYRIDTNLYINGESILSQEGTTQGDPLAIWPCMLSAQIHSSIV